VPGEFLENVPGAAYARRRIDAFPGHCPAVWIEKVNKGRAGWIRRVSSDRDPSSAWAIQRLPRQLYCSRGFGSRKLFGREIYRGSLCDWPGDGVAVQNFPETGL